MVTALRYPESSIDVPAASSIVSGETLSEKLAPNINEALQDVPGVGALGSAGFALVPSIRGLARRRVLYLVDGARLESDRRTGPNASFVNPEDIERIEVLRSASSVFYGSDAIGGVIHLLTRVPRFDGGLHGRVQTGYATANGEKRIGLGLEGSAGTWAFFLSFQYADAGRYRIPGGTKVLQSQYTQGSFLAKAAHRTDAAGDRPEPARRPRYGHRQAEHERGGQADLVSQGEPEPLPAPLEGKERRERRGGPLPRFRQSQFPRDPDRHLRRFPDQGILRQDRQHRIRRPDRLFEKARAVVPP